MTRGIEFPRDNPFARVPCSAPAVAKEEEEVTAEKNAGMQEEDETVDFDVSEMNNREVPGEHDDMLVVKSEGHLENGE